MRCDINDWQRSHRNSGCVLVCAIVCAALQELCNAGPPHPGARLGETYEDWEKRYGVGHPSFEEGDADLLSAWHSSTNPVVLSSQAAPKWPELSDEIGPSILAPSEGQIFFAAAGTSELECGPSERSSACAARCVVVLASCPAHLCSRSDGNLTLTIAQSAGSGARQGRATLAPVGPGLSSVWLVDALLPSRYHVSLVDPAGEVHDSISFEVRKNSTKAPPPPQHVVAAALGHDASLAAVHQGEVTVVIELERFFGVRCFLHISHSTLVIAY